MLTFGDTSVPSKYLSNVSGGKTTTVTKFDPVASVKAAAAWTVTAVESIPEKAASAAQSATQYMETLPVIGTGVSAIESAAEWIAPDPEPEIPTNTIDMTGFLQDDQLAYEAPPIGSPEYTANPNTGEVIVVPKPGLTVTKKPVSKPNYLTYAMIAAAVLGGVFIIRRTINDNE